MIWYKSVLFEGRERISEPFTIADKPWFQLPPASKQKENHAIIIGGGLAGTSAAYSFARQGWYVTLIERCDALAQQASGNPAGIVMPILSAPDDKVGQFSIAAYRYALQHLKHLGITPAAGVLQLRTVVSSRKPYKHWESHPLMEAGLMRYVDVAEASILANIPLSQEGVFFPHAGWVRPADLCNGYVEGYSDAITTYYTTEALSLNRDIDGWQVYGKERQCIASAPVVVIANALDAREFEQTRWLPLRQVRGQLTYLNATPLSQKLSTVLCYEGYATPCVAKNQHIVGATFKVDNNDATLYPSEHQENIAMLTPYVPHEFLAGGYDEAKGRVAFRAVSPDQRPMVGCVPDYQAFLSDYQDIHHGNRFKHYPSGSYHKGLYLSVGHGSRGLVSTPLSAELLVSMAVGDDLPVDSDMVNMLNPARFLIKMLKTRRV